MKKLLTLIFFLMSSLIADLDKSQVLCHIVLDKDNGHYVEGGAWDSSVLEGKITMMMYVDPDEKYKGKVIKPIIEGFENDLDFSDFQILVILNLKATWKPNALIESLLKSKMQAYPKRIYVIDKESILVKKWGLLDDEYNLVLINDKVKPVYQHHGQWEDSQIRELDTQTRLLIQKFYEQ
ncbi:hypothetical protein JHD50_09645 [Sulfurimonas sp. MAG313]|nr:YtfJ family protein [Sulfurimonas sp. MAG313]MDF1881561.1 hypothetical protein [Sulfurimonas sp. MAG313]